MQNIKKVKQEEALNKARNHFLSLGNFDDDSFQEEVSKISRRYGITPEDVGEAYFAARDIATLVESERLDGGDGSIARNLDTNDVIEASFSKGINPERTQIS